ncbi:MAG: magnesium transporter [Lactobacillales bacterium]|nr:magnesium transporter [Lactobacillales bacterium]
MNEVQEEIETQFENILSALKNEQMAEFRPRFLALHKHEQGQFYESLDISERELLYQYISPKELAEVFDILEEDNEDIHGFLEEMMPEYAAEMLSEMYSDNAADLLATLTDKQADDYLGLMDVEDANDIKELMHYEENTAGSIMTTEFVAIVANQTVRSAMYVLKGQAEVAEMVYYVYVVDNEERLLGVISLRDLIIHEDDMMIRDIMNERVISVSLDDDQQDVAQMFRDYDFLALPVIDSGQHLQGIVTVDDIIDVIDDEAVSDYSGLAGVNVDEVSENPFKAASKRLPWLITLLFLGMATASLINHFEALVSQASILAVFITTITGTAGNAGTQSLAVAVRRLAFKDEEVHSIPRLILSEILTGMLTGIVTGIAIFLVIFVWKHNLMLGVAVGTAMFCAITVANLAGSLIPMLMERLGFDPAVASGPFISTLSDLTSVLIYFNIAGLFLSVIMN